MHNVPEKKNQAINVSLVLETVLQMFPLSEMEFLSCVGEIVGEWSYFFTFKAEKLLLMLNLKAH